MADSSSTLLSKIRDSIRRLSDGDAQAALASYGKTHCLRPIKISQINSLTGKPRDMLVPCGHCWHCRSSKMNEWVTRMYSHCEDFKNVYYVTLTYRSIYKDVHVKDGTPMALLRDYLKDALWHLDSRNSTGHMSWNPTVLCKKHYQDFLKRLRRNTGITDLTYVVCGEYGHEYARPHMHLILWTNSTLTLRDIQKAWSLRYRRVRVHHKDDDLFTDQHVYVTSKRASDHVLLLGRVDFHDLTRNGTFFDPSVQVALEPGMRAKSGAYVFSYVCKYLMKSEFNDNRVKMAWNALHPYSNTHEEWLERVFSLSNDPETVHEYHRLKMLAKYKDSKISELNRYAYSKYHQIFLQNHYETDTWKSGHLACKNGELHFNQEIAKSLYFDSSDYVSCESGCPEFRFPAFYESFRLVYRPFFEMSRGTAIGSLYQKTHLSEHANGVFSRVSLQPENCYVVPSYFWRKLQEYNYALRSSSSGHEVASAVKGCLPLLRADLALLTKDDDPRFVRPFPVSNFKDYAVDFVDSLCRRYSLREGSRRWLILRAGELDYSALCYEYNRSSSHYELQYSLPFDEFSAYWLPRLDDYMKECSIRQSRSDRDNRDFSCVQDELTLQYQRTKDSPRPSRTYEELVNLIEDSFSISAKERQIKYELEHNFCE